MENPHDDAHARTPAAVLEALGSGPAGLEPAEAARRLAASGPNELPDAARRTAATILLEQLRSPLLLVLLGAAAVALALGERGDAAVIAAVVLLNAGIGTFQEARAERSLDALRRMAAPRAVVRRGGAPAEIPSREVVPGDILVLAAGDAVVADARVLESASLQVAEAALTGESLPVGKDPAVLPAETRLPDRRNRVHAGTHATAGRGTAVVTATGTATELGRIAALAGASPPPATPLQRRIARFGRVVAVLAAAALLAVVAVGTARGIPFREIFLVGVSQMVSLVPEGLPAVMTVGLAVGVQRMARRRAVVRRLEAVETLGATTVIATDKTGTLTANELSVVEARAAAGAAWTVEGEGYAPEGRLLAGGRPVAAGEDADLAALLEAAALCNDARLLPPGPGEPRWRAVGDPTEAALLAFAARGGLDATAARAARPRVAEIPFDADARAMATAHGGTGGALVLAKGAPEVILALCGSARRGGADAPLDGAARAALAAAAEGLATRGLRVLALAAERGGTLDPAAGMASLRGRLALLGFVGQIDAARPGTAEAVARCRAAGIRTVMVTGDHRATGLAVARALGIAGDSDRAMDGAELEAAPDADLDATLDRTAVFARVLPAQKLRLVEALRRRGEVVAMTGDGVNDAPALLRADVGIAMGRGGTEVARSAADIVLTDDDFGTIAAAVEEGRLVRRNLRGATVLLIATSAAEVATLLGALAVGLPLPFAAVQILWNNLVTEGLVAVNLAMEPLRGDEMQRPPARPDEPLLPRPDAVRAALMAATITAVTLGWYALRVRGGGDLALARTEAFTLLAVCEWWNAISCRDDARSALRRGLAGNRWLAGGLLLGVALQAAVVYLPAAQGLFRTVALPVSSVLGILVAGSAVLVVEEFRKAVVRGRGAGDAPPRRPR